MTVPETLAREYHDFALRRAGAVLSRRGVPHVEPDDLASIAMFDAVRTYDPAKGASFATWLNAQVQFAAVDAFRFARKAKRREPTREPLCLNARADSGRDPGDREGFEHLIHTLPAEHAALLRLMFVDGCTKTEAARRLGRCPSWAVTTLRKALDAIRPRAEAMIA